MGDVHGRTGSCDHFTWEILGTLAVISRWLWVLYQRVDLGGPPTTPRDWASECGKGWEGGPPLPFYWSICDKLGDLGVLLTSLNSLKHIHSVTVMYVLISKWD